MTRSTFLLIIAIYNFILAASMLLMPALALQNYGIPNIDINHSNILQYLGINILGFGFIALIFRNAQDSIILKNYLMIGAVIIALGVVIGLMQAMKSTSEVPVFYYADLVFRAILGFGFFYFWQKVKGTKQID